MILYAHRKEEKGNEPKLIVANDPQDAKIIALKILRQQTI
jgi:hypothetical protein